MATPPLLTLLTDIAPFAKVDLAWNAVFEFDFALVLGDLDTIRSYAEQHHHTGVIR